jgi:hypothetical protein
LSEWTPYRIGIPKGASPSSDDGRRLETVYHVVHLPTARRILEDGHLRSGLIYDESRLRRSRICVTWLSANTWAAGSIYGNVQFAFPWSKQIHKRRCYWVEVMTGYNPHAYRILLTDRDLSESKHVREYDPASDRGPLRERDGAWYWNDRYTSEFLVESDISLEDCTGLEFISHHSQICRLNGANCPDFDTTAEKVGGGVMAFLLGNGLHSFDDVLTQGSRRRADRLLSRAVDMGISGIWRTLGRRKELFGGAIKSKSSRNAVLRGALALYGHGKTSAARELVALLSSQGTFEKALEEVVNEHFEIAGWTLPD